MRRCGRVIVRFGRGRGRIEGAARVDDNVCGYDCIDTFTRARARRGWRVGAVREWRARAGRDDRWRVRI